MSWLCFIVCLRNCQDLAVADTPERGEEKEFDAFWEHTVVRDLKTKFDVDVSAAELRVLRRFVCVCVSRLV